MSLRQVMTTPDDWPYWFGGGALVSGRWRAQPATWRSPPSLLWGAPVRWAASSCAIYLETAGPGIAVLIADRDVGAARALAQGLGGGRRVRAVEVDAHRPVATARALAGVFAVIHCGPHGSNLAVMEVALRVGAHYLDLGGLFHVTRAQIEVDGRFRRAGLLALVAGIGAAPGIVNVLARAAADDMDRVDEIHILIGTSTTRPGREPGVLASSYSLDTIVDEASLPAAVFTRGALEFVEPMSDPCWFGFPAPVGLRHPARSASLEVATLPVSFRDKGIREVSFRIAFPDSLAARLRFLHALGLTSANPIRANGVVVAPRDVLMALHQRLPRPAPGGPPTSTRCCARWCAACAAGVGSRTWSNVRDGGYSRPGPGRRRGHRLPAVDRGAAAARRANHGAQHAAARARHPAGAVLRGAPRARGGDNPAPAPSDVGARNGRGTAASYPPRPRRTSHARAST